MPVSSAAVFTSVSDLPTAVEVWFAPLDCPFGGEMSTTNTLLRDVAASWTTRVYLTKHKDSWLDNGHIVTLMSRQL